MKKKRKWKLKRWDFSDCKPCKRQFHIFFFDNGVEFAWGYKKWIFYR